MDRTPDDQNLLRRYLLAELGEDEARRVESRLVADGDFFEELEAAEDELLDDYLRGALTGPERARLEANLLSTPEGEKALGFARAFGACVAAAGGRPAGGEATRAGEVVRPGRWRGAWSRHAPQLKAAAVALLAVALGLAAWRAFFHQSDLDRGLSALREAHRAARPTEARVSGFDYAPHVVTRGGTEAPGDLARERAAALLFEAERRSPGPATRHALGRLYLAGGQPDKAAAQFEAALRDAPGDATIHSDLGAALLEKGRLARGSDNAARGLEEFARALEHLGRALELDGSSREALFNRALVYEQMTLPRRAAEEWRRYLELDPTSQWAEEARRRLRALEERGGVAPVPDDGARAQKFLGAWRARDEGAAWAAIERGRGLAGDAATAAVADRYVAASLAGSDDEAREMIEALAWAGRVAAARSGDHFIADLARFYAAAPRSRLATLAEARRRLKLGHERLLGFRPGEALPHYQEAARLFRRAGGGPEALYVEYPLGHCHLARPDAGRALGHFGRIVGARDAGRYTWLLGQAHGGAANAEMARKDYSAALGHSRRALELSRRAADPEGVMKATAQLGQVYLFLGNYREALRQHHRALELAAGGGATQLQVWRSHFTIPLSLAALGLNRAALEFQREAVRLASEMGHAAPLLSRSRINLGLLHSALGDHAAAEGHARTALDLAREIPDERARAEALAYASLHLGHVRRRAGDYDAAAADYRRAAAFYDSEGAGAAHAFGYAARKGRLLVCLASGECPDAGREIAETMRLYEQHRSTILEENDRNSFFDAEQDICDVAVGYEFARRGDARAAFELSERCRARSLLDMLGPGGRGGGERGLRLAAARPLAASEIQARLPDGAQVVSFAVLDERLVMWVVSGAGVTGFSREVGRRELEAEVSAFLRLAASPARDRGDAAEARRRGAALYRLLVEPAEGALVKGGRVCFVPDKILNHLPFAALVSPATGRHLAEDYAVTLAPSAGLFVLNSEAARARGAGGRESVLSVGDPNFDRRAFPGLASLPAARGEAAAVAAVYGAPRALVGGAATKPAVESALRGAEVIHFALHAVADEQAPMSSGLLLAGGDDGSDGRGAEPAGLLRAQEVYRMRLPRARLVVLSACRSGVERYYGGEGMVGLARAFLAAGAPVVVASLWSVDSEATAELMVALHRRRVAGDSAAEALRGAQAEMIRHPDARLRHPFYWAAFAAIGGEASL